jgi:hypothetical protein
MPWLRLLMSRLLKQGIALAHNGQVRTHSGTEMKAVAVHREKVMATPSRRGHEAVAEIPHVCARRVPAREIAP